MNAEEIQYRVVDCIKQVAQEQGITLPEIQPGHRIVEDLGFNSLDVATLTAVLETTFKVDPFSMGVATITEIRTFADVCSVYDRCLNGGSADEEKNEDQALDARMQRRLKRAS